MGFFRVFHLTPIMIRFANPGSNLDNMAEIFVALFDDLSSQTSFGLDDMSACMVGHNLAASCGRMGAEALRRSIRADRSRDPLYNQSKMYSEVYRALGWITSLQDSRLTFQFTLLGAHVAQAKGSIKALMKECFLGIVYPNPTLDIKYDVSLRPFKTFLSAMRDLDGYISRDELIYGPMHLRDDRNEDEYASMIADIKKCRAEHKLLPRLNVKLRERNITYITAGNYTRFPLAVLKWGGWAERVSKRLYGRLEPFCQLTQEGRDQLAIVERLRDFRRSDLDKIDPSMRGCLITTCFYGMLGRCGFDMNPVRQNFDVAQKTLRANKITSSQMLFSPLQELTPKEIISYNCIDPIVSGADARSGGVSFEFSSGDNGRLRNAETTFRVTLVGRSVDTAHSELDSVWESSGHNVANAVKRFVEAHSRDNKEDFYPLVARLFSLSGFPCEASRNGVNYQRADATITLDDGFLIPIEVKSPGEELSISVKAVRQAVENRIILLSRQPKQSRSNLTSLVVGYTYPNDRAEVNELLHDIHVAFGFNIGIFDFASLTAMAIEATYNGRTIAKKDLELTHGFFSIDS